MAEQFTSEDEARMTALEAAVAELREAIDGLVYDMVQRKSELLERSPAIRASALRHEATLVD